MIDAPAITNRPADAATNARVSAFLAFRREDRAAAEWLRAWLEREGVTVRTDEDVRARDFRAAIDSDIDAHTAVVVLWSPGSANSDWLYSLASIALDQGKYVGLVVDPGMNLQTELPAPFSTRPVERMLAPNAGLPGAQVAAYLWDPTAAEAAAKQVVQAVRARLWRQDPVAPTILETSRQALSAAVEASARRIAEGGGAGRFYFTKDPREAARRQRSFAVAARLLAAETRRPELLDLARYLAALRGGVSPSQGGALDPLLELFTHAERRRDPRFWFAVSDIAYPFAPSLSMDAERAARRALGAPTDEGAAKPGMIGALARQFPAGVALLGLMAGGALAWALKPAETKETVRVVEVIRNQPAPSISKPLPAPKAAAPAVKPAPPPVQKQATAPILPPPPKAAPASAPPPPKVTTASVPPPVAAPKGSAAPRAATKPILAPPPAPRPAAVAPPAGPSPCGHAGANVAYQGGVCRLTVTEGFTLERYARANYGEDWRTALNMIIERNDSKWADARRVEVSANHGLRAIDMVFQGERFEMPAITEVAARKSAARR